MAKCNILVQKCFVWNIVFWTLMAKCCNILNSFVVNVRNPNLDGYGCHLNSRIFYCKAWTLVIIFLHRVYLISIILLTNLIWNTIIDTGFVFDQKTNFEQKKWAPSCGAIKESLRGTKAGFKFLFSTFLHLKVKKTDRQTDKQTDRQIDGMSSSAIFISIKMSSKLRGIPSIEFLLQRRNFISNKKLNIRKTHMKVQILKRSRVYN